MDGNVYAANGQVIGRLMRGAPPSGTRDAGLDEPAQPVRPPPGLVLPPGPSLLLIESAIRSLCVYAFPSAPNPCPLYSRRHPVHRRRRDRRQRRQDWLRRGGESGNAAAPCAHHGQRLRTTLAIH